MYDTTIDKDLVGHKITNIYFDSDHLAFKLDNGEVKTYGVEGDCCSRSYFYDFLGVKKLLDNGRVISVKEVPLDESDPRCKRQGHEDELKCYGFEIVTEDPKFGEVTTVFSFRNDSNGYYGGWIRNDNFDATQITEIKDDVLEAR